MAVDTLNKRGSIIGMGLSVFLPLADGAIVQSDRQQFLHLYSGIDADEPVITENGNTSSLLRLNYVNRTQFFIF